MAKPGNAVAALRAAMADATADDIVAALRELDEDRWSGVRSGMQALDMADYEGPAEPPETCPACGGKVRHGRCRDCGLVV